MEPQELYTVRALFERYYARLCEFAHSIVACRDTAQDLVQDVFVAVLEDDPLRRMPTTGIQGYLYGMVKHAALNNVRRRAIGLRVMANCALTDVEEAAIERDIMRAEIFGELYSALGGLPKGCADVCKMAYFDGKKNQEIADALGVSINTVKSQKQRAIQLLRQRLSPQALSVLVWLLQ